MNDSLVLLSSLHLGKCEINGIVVVTLVVLVSLLNAKDVARYIRISRM